MTLLEREAQLQRLGELGEEAADGEGALVFVAGEAGVGKTSLIRAFLARAARGVRVAVGVCDPLPAPAPLGPLLDVADVLGLEPPGAAPSPTSGFRSVLASLAAAPTLLAIEDVHWADDATLDLLRFVGRRVGGHPVLLVATYRNDEVTSAHPLRRVLGELATAPRVVRMTVPPLTVEGVRRLAEGRDLDVPELHRRTGGNAFFVTEILASDEVGLPVTVRDAVLARVATLGASARAVLEAAAVVGPRVEPVVLHDVVAGEAGHVGDVLDRGLLVPRGPAWEFRHELARQAVVEAIPLRRRTTLHRLALESLQARGRGEADPARLAYHAEGARDAGAVLTYAVRAAERASSLHSHREAVTQYAQALRHADGLGAPERADLLERYALEAHLTDRLRASIAAREEAVEIWRREGRPERQAESLGRLSLTFIRAGRNADAEEASRRSLALLRGRPVSPAHALAYRYQSYLRMLDRDVAAAITWGERAVAAAEDTGDVASVVQALNSIGSARMVADDVERGRELLERAATLARDAGLDHHVVDAYDNLGSGAGETYQLELAERYLDRTIAFAADHEIDSGYARSWRALVHLYRGEYERAAQLAGPLVADPDAAAISRIMALVALGRLRTRRGDPDADAVLDEALELAQRTGTLQRLAPVRAARAEAAWFAKDRDRARAEADAVHDLAVRKGHAWFVGEAAYGRWRAGGPAEAPSVAARPFALQIRGEWRAAADAWHARGLPFEEARALAEGDDDGALRRALAIFEALGARPAAREVVVRLGSHGLRRSAGSRPDPLTKRQLQVLGLVVAGLTDAEIAVRLVRSPKTVGHHVSAILAKLEVRNRTEAAREAVRRGIVEPG